MYTSPQLAAAQQGGFYANPPRLQEFHLRRLLRARIGGIFDATHGNSPVNEIMRQPDVLTQTRMQIR